jgi:phospholipase/carboxylesterase
MPRIRYSDLPLIKKIEEPSLELQAALFCPVSQNSVHAFFSPLHYEPRYAYPLIVWLHSPGSDERQLRTIMPLISMRNFVAVSPRGTSLDETRKDARGGYGWPNDKDHLSGIEHRIFEAIDAVSHKFNINKRLVFLAGYDIGGTTAFRVALNHPQHFAGVLSICGSFPTGRTPLMNLSLARKLPILLCVGRNSDKYPPDTVCENLRLLHTAGMSVTLRQYPCGHELTPQMLGDLNRWIMDQIDTIKAANSPDSSLCPD